MKRAVWQLIFCCLYGSYELIRLVYETNLLVSVWQLWANNTSLQIQTSSVLVLQLILVNETNLLLYVLDDI